MKKFLIPVAILALATSCADRDPNDPGVEYASQMYHSLPYDPYSQMKENSINPMGLNMREPAMNTVPRQFNDGATVSMEVALNYPLGQDSLEFAGRVLRNPLAGSTDTSLESEGKALYTKFCSHCHGVEGDGKGEAGKKYGGVANLKGFTTQPDGHIYHVITVGKGRMWPHGSQILPMDRWKIVNYVDKLRGYTQPAAAPAAAPSNAKTNP